jgi:hypothetical protein
MGQSVGDLRIAHVTGPGEIMVRLVETFWRGSLQWWIVEDLLTKRQHEVHTYQIDDETYNEMEALAWASK